MVLEYTGPAERAGTSVSQTLRRGLNISAGMVRRLKQAQAITCGGAPVFTNRILAAGDTVCADVDAAEPPCDLLPEPGNLDILWESPLFLTLNKPAGVLIHPSHARNTGTLANFAAYYLYKTRGNAACHAVNRLDRDTSGVVLFAKNAYAKEAGARALADAQKTYLAVALGAFDPPAGVIRLPIRRFSPTEMRRIPALDGQPAVTHYETAAVGSLHGQSVSLLRLRLETGRTHQIRVHTSACGHPLLGDQLYGNAASLALSAACGFDAQLLHAAVLRFTDPLSGQQVEIHAPVQRADFKKFLANMKISS